MPGQAETHTSQLEGPMVRRFHSKLKRPMIIIQPSEYYVTEQDEIIATILGSCVSVCLKDETNGIGGMNHFMLPGDFSVDQDFQSQNARYGMYAMELLIGDIIKRGGDRSNLTAKVFGGGHVLPAVAPTKDSVPSTNLKFIRSFLAMEGIKVLKSDVGGTCGRKVLYLPASGRVLLKRLLRPTDKVASRDRRYRSRLAREMDKEDLTLF